MPRATSEQLKEHQDSLVHYFELCGYKVKKIINLPGSEWLSNEQNSVLVIYQDKKRIGEVFFRGQAWCCDSDLESELDWQTVLQECEIPDEFCS